MNPINFDKGEFSFDPTKKLLPVADVPGILIPFFSSLIQAGTTGFPSPAEEYIELEINLQKQLIPNPSSTFIFRVTGHSMVGVGIMDGALLIVDRSIKVSEGKIVVATLNGENVVKIFTKQKGDVYLLSANDAFKPRRVSPDEDLQFFGVVTYFINQA